MTVDIRADKLVAAREDLNKRLAKESIKLSVGDFVTKGVAMALRQNPGLNASFEPDAIIRHGEINIGLAVALDEGLIVPVLHQADTLGLREIRVRSEALATAARSGRPDRRSSHRRDVHDLESRHVRHQNSSTRSSICPRSASWPSAPPRNGPVVDGDKLVIGTVMTVTLTADHRAVDGATAAQFLQTLKALLEEPVAMLL